jgi:hypothetical protein
MLIIQADLLNSLRREFDYVYSVGVLHLPPIRVEPSPQLQAGKTGR